MPEVVDTTYQNDFPANIVNCLVTYFQDFFSAENDMVVMDRPIRPTDPARCIGITAFDWVPVLNSDEIGHFNGPTLNQYNIRIQNLCKGDRETAGRRYSVDAKIIRLMLAVDTVLDVRLHDLTIDAYGVHERVQKRGVRNQRYMNNEIRGTFLFLAVTDFWVQTETVPI